VSSSLKRYHSGCFFDVEVNFDAGLGKFPGEMGEPRQSGASRQSSAASEAPIGSKCAASAFLCRTTKN
jgi:hypothetical protein